MHVGCKMYFKMTAGSYKTSIGLRQEERQRKLFVLSDLLFTELSASVSQYSRLHFATPPTTLVIANQVSGNTKISTPDVLISKKM